MATMTETAAKGFGRKAARDNRYRENCDAPLATFRQTYGYEYSEAFIRGYWAECLSAMGFEV